MHCDIQHSKFETKYRNNSSSKDEYNQIYTVINDSKTKIPYVSKMLDAATPRPQRYETKYNRTMIPTVESVTLIVTVSKQ